MSMKDIIKKSIVENLAMDISAQQIILVFVVTLFISIYIFQFYKMVKKAGFYSHTFNISMAVISIVTAGIILSMQSNIVISLGMVGALSIVRFRTAIKDPMDLLFLFWSIGTGIICGGGNYLLAVLMAIFVSIAVLVFEFMPKRKAPLLVVINSSETEDEKIIDTLKSNTKHYYEKSRNITGHGVDYVFEVVGSEQGKLGQSLSSVEGVYNVSVLSHDGEVRM